MSHCDGYQVRLMTQTGWETYSQFKCWHIGCLQYMTLSRHGHHVNMMLLWSHTQKVVAPAQAGIPPL